MSIFINPNGLNNSGGGGTPVDVPNASTSQAGKVQLSNAIDSDSQSMASTPLAVKTALAESKTYTDDVIANLNIQDIIDDLNDHELALINTEQGLHGVRIWQDKIQQTNDNGTTWIDVASNINIVDDLNSTDATSALSANQGNVIKLLIEQLQLDLTNHEAKIASDTEYGHIKIDNDTLQYNVDGQLVAVGGGTVKSINGELPDVNGNVELPTATDLVEGLTTLHTIVDETETKSITPKAVKEYIDDLESTLIKHPFELRPTTQGQLEFDMPAIYNLNPEWYITSLHFNSIKLLESQYSIVEKVAGDTTQGYKIVLTSPAPDYNSAIYELELISGKALANGTGSTGSVNSVNNILPDTAGNVEIPQATTTDEGLTILHDTVDDTVDRAVTPKAVKDYIADFESTLTIDQRRIPVAQGQSIIPIDNLNYTPQDFVLMLFNNTTMEFENGYTIQSSATSNSGYEILLTQPIPYPEGAEFELILIYGKAVANGEGATGTVISVNGILPDTTGNVEIPLATSTDEGLTILHDKVDSTIDRAITPDAVKRYLDDMESSLAKLSFELIPTTQGQVEFDMPTIYDPTMHIDFLYFNSMKLLETEYSIVEKVAGDATQGYKLVLDFPATDYTQAVYNLTLVSGRAIGGTASTSTIASVNNITPDVNGNIEIPTATNIVEGLTVLHTVVDDTETKSVTPKAVKQYYDANNRFYVGVNPPTDTELFWIKE